MKTNFLFFAFVVCCFLSIRSQTTIHVPQDYTTIQEAINASEDEYIVLVDTGTYYENINFKGKAITVKSHYDAADNPDSVYIYRTIIDGSQAANPDSTSVVYFINGEDNGSVISGFTIQGGHGSPGSGGGMSGGGIFCKGSGPVIEHNRIVDNHCEEGGSFASGGGIFVYNSYGHSTVIRYNIISGNECINSAEGEAGTTGGGISAVYAGECLIHENIICDNYILHRENVGYAEGAGIECFSTKGIVTNNTISNNVAETEINHYYPWGGGFYSWSLKEGSIISGNIIINNSIGGQHCKGGGIGILDNQGTVTIDKNIIKGNFSKWGSGITIRLGADANITNNVIHGNEADFKTGGIYIIPQSDKKDGFYHQRGNSLNDFSDERQQSGKDVSLQLLNNTFLGNTSNSGGAALYYENSSPLIAFNNIFYDNTTYNPGWDIEIENSSSAYLYNNLLDTSRVGGGAWIGEHNFTGDPGFLEDSCHICGSSCCIDMGANSIDLNGTVYSCPDHDIDGNGRPQNGQADIGADEMTYVGIEKINLSDNLLVKVYPNPVKHHATFEIELHANMTVTLEIFDHTGRAVDLLKTAPLSSGMYNFTWNTEGMTPGVYIYRIQAGEIIASGKIILNR